MIIRDLDGQKHQIVLLVEKIRKIIANDANSTVKMLTEELNLSYSTIYTILTGDLGKRKVRARFVPHQLNAPPHKIKKVNEFLMKKQICIIDHPSYSYRVTIFCPQN